MSAGPIAAAMINDAMTDTAIMVVMYDFPDFLFYFARNNSRAFSIFQ